MERADDAGIYKLSDKLAIVQTLDFFTPVVDDAYTFGQIAVANALSDVYAKGGKPLTAMNIVCFPTETMDMAILREILLGGLDNGEVLVTVSPPGGYTPTGVASRTLWISGTDVALGGIGFRPTGWLVGSVFADNDGDSQRAPDESGIGNVTVTISGPAVTTTVTALAPSTSTLISPNWGITASGSLPQMESLPTPSLYRSR